jgi:uncharacterized protein YbjT (DUF2867 family)
MFLITGITGKVGGAAARHLLNKGKQVRALVRDPAKAAAWSAKGVELVKGDWTDPAAMTQALNGVEGAYLMMPPIQTPSRDFREAKAVIASYKEALAKSRRPSSSCCRPWARKDPPAWALLLQLICLSRLLATSPSPWRSCAPGHSLKTTCSAFRQRKAALCPSFTRQQDRKLPMIATEDIGAEIASLLTTGWTGKRIIELGSMVSADDLAAALGQALGRDVKAQAIPRQAWAGALEQMGIPRGARGPLKRWSTA